MKLGFSPNTITLLSMVIGLMGAACLAMGSYRSGMLGALLFQLAVIVDCCDGEVARLTFAESRLGQELDLVSDNIVHMAVFAGIAWGTYEQSPVQAGYLAVALGLDCGGLDRVFSVVCEHGQVPESQCLELAALASSRPNPFRFYPSARGQSGFFHRGAGIRLFRRAALVFMARGSRNKRVCDHDGMEPVSSGFLTSILTGSDTLDSATPHMLRGNGRQTSPSRAMRYPTPRTVTM